MTERQKITIFLTALVIAALTVIVVVNLISYDPDRQARARFRSDMRSLATALETYYQDHGSYPAMVPLSRYASDRAKLERAGGANMQTVAWSGINGAAGLTTPVAYIPRVFPDLFAPEPNMPFAYFATAKGWILVSPGPDRHYDMNPSRDYDSSITQPSLHIVALCYDPTNGHVSGGDVSRTKQ